MASGGGSSGQMAKTLSRRMTRLPTRLGSGEGGGGEEEVPYTKESELVPSSLQAIVPFLRVADEIEQEYPRVAYLCRFVALERTQTDDPTSIGRGVRQFKTYLLRRLEKDDLEINRSLGETDPREIRKFYDMYCKKYLYDPEIKQEDKVKYFKTAQVLYEVLKRLSADEDVKDVKPPMHAEGVAYFSHYNILPLNVPPGPQPAVMELPEIKAALELLRRTQKLPMPLVTPRNADPTAGPQEGERTIQDLLDWLGLTFGFQKGNVENQKEHLILLLANIDMRNGGHAHGQEAHRYLISIGTVKQLKDKIFQNYDSWWKYIHLESKIMNTSAQGQEYDLLYIGLYLLIWGEASNVRFMPECICYIFHRMAEELSGILFRKWYAVEDGYFKPPFEEEGSFLQKVIQPIFDVMLKEAKRNKRGTASHSKWRNYDDLNEYFWSKECLKLGWPFDLTSSFFVSEERPSINQGHVRVYTAKRKSKTNFVEVRTFLHLFRSFDRMWVFLILAFQAMLIVAWSPSGSLSAIFGADVFTNVLSIFITAAFLNFVQAAMEIILSFKAWGSMEYTQILRYLLKFVMAIVWVIILPIAYAGSFHQHRTGLIKYIGNWLGDWQSQSVYSFAIVIYLIPNVLGALLFLFLPLRRYMECSNSRFITFLMWWTQPKLYVARGMHEDTISLIKYTGFWILLLICKMAFSYYIEIHPLVGPTKTIMYLGVPKYEWAEILPSLQNNLGVVISIWAPIVLVYFMDIQIWYAIFSAAVGGFIGAFSRLGEIRTLSMLRSRFEGIPGAFSKALVPHNELLQNHFQKVSKEERFSRNIEKFSHVWNAFIKSLRDEDLINNRERDLLIVPSSSSDISVIQWPPFLLASKIPIVLDMAKDFKDKDDELIKKIKQDTYKYHAVIECYQTFVNILSKLVEDSDKKVIAEICTSVETSLSQQTLLRDFKMAELLQLSNKIDKLLNLLKSEHEDLDQAKLQIVNVLQDTMEIITQDVMVKGQHILKDKSDSIQLFGNVNLDFTKDVVWKEKFVRLHLLLTVKESAIYVPTNLDARRRITFFANSLFMQIPDTPKVCNMTSFSVLTPYFKEDVLYSADELYKKNEDGISILFYLRKIYPEEWRNFLERIDYKPKDEEALKNRMEDIRPWASYRGQTLTRTVRGMMYYRQALELQCLQDMSEDNVIYSSSEQRQSLADRASAIADIKFTYVVSCQIYGTQKMSKDARDRSCYINILDLMLTYPSLRVAYIDEVERAVNGRTEKSYYSVLVKGGEKYDEEIYRIKLPGRPTDIGEGKPENQNHAIIFTRGEALQTIDMNQDNYLEEAFKIRNLLEEFQNTKYGEHRPTILGLREHIFTGSVSSLAWFMSNQETSFVTIGQRVLANPLKVRFHYGHPDVFDRLFHITRGGISKASKVINLSEDIFAGFNSTMRRGNVTHHEYMQVGKGRDVGLNQISSFEAKVANGNGEQTLSRDVYRLGQRFDFYRMLSFYFTTVGFYFSSMVTVLTVYVFLYGKLYLVMSGLERSILLDQRIKPEIKQLENALASQSIFQLGVLLVVPMVIEVGLERGFRIAFGEFIIMQLQLATVFFTFQLGTKAHYYGRTILHGGAKYRPTGRGFVVYHAKFADNYRMYSRSHFVKGLELVALLVVYLVYGHSYRSSPVYLFVTFSIWFLVASWLFAPFVFNPSCFEWQKTVDDWADWTKWMGNRGGIGMPVDQSWEAWWISEQDHLRHASVRGIILEIILSLRFLIYQYGVVYHLDIARHSTSITIYGLSWLVMLVVIIILKMVSIGRQRFGTDLQLMFRILKGLLTLGVFSVMAVLFVALNLTVRDVLASILGFMPTGWCILLIAQACKPIIEKTTLWDSIMELARAYEYAMGTFLFLPIAVLSWFPFVSEFQTRLLFNQAFSRGLQISRILAGQKDIGEFE